jgi:hypothetical protein
MLQAKPIILCEVQTSEAQRLTNSLLQNSMREEHQIKNADSLVEFRGRSQKFKP